MGSPNKALISIGRRLPTTQPTPREMKKTLRGARFHAAPNWAPTQGYGADWKPRRGWFWDIQALDSRACKGAQPRDRWPDGTGTCLLLEGSCPKNLPKRKDKEQVAKCRLARTRINEPLHSGHPAGNGKSPRLADGLSGWGASAVAQARHILDLGEGRQQSIRPQVAEVVECQQGECPMDVDKMRKKLAIWAELSRTFAK